MICYVDVKRYKLYTMKNLESVQLVKIERNRRYEGLFMDENGEFWRDTGEHGLYDHFGCASFIETLKSF